MRYRSVKEVKQVLPDVKAYADNRCYLCSVRGRKEKFATVTPYKILNPTESFEIIPTGVEFSWTAILNAVNDQRTKLQLN